MCSHLKSVFLKYLLHIFKIPWYCLKVYVPGGFPGSTGIKDTGFSFGVMGILEYFGTIDR
jgi:hypothetical protein